MPTMFFDSKGFRGDPDPFDPVEEGLVGVPGYRTRPVNAPMKEQQLPPLHGAADYRSKCASNIPSEKQAGTRQWLMKSADEVMQLARKRHEARMIDIQAPYSPVEGPGFERVVECNADRCAMQYSGNSRGIGVYRREELPAMAGTWSNAYGFRAEGFGVGGGKMKQEGGRNTRRG